MADAKRAFAEIWNALPKTRRPQNQRNCDVVEEAITDARLREWARRAYLAGDWDQLERALGIPQTDEGRSVLVTDIRDRAVAGGASPEGADDRG